MSSCMPIALCVSASSIHHEGSGRTHQTLVRLRMLKSKLHHASALVPGLLGLGIRLKVTVSPMRSWSRTTCLAVRLHSLCRTSVSFYLDILLSTSPVGEGMRLASAHWTVSWLKDYAERSILPASHPAAAVCLALLQLALVSCAPVTSPCQLISNRFPRSRQSGSRWPTSLQNQSGVMLALMSSSVCAQPQSLKPARCIILSEQGSLQYP